MRTFRRIPARLSGLFTRGRDEQRLREEFESHIAMATDEGVGLGMVSGRHMETLLYGVKGTDIGMLTIPSVAIVAGAMIAAAVPVMRAVRINPIAMLRSE